MNRLRASWSVAAGVTIRPCASNSARARGMCNADVTSKICRMPRLRNISAVKRAFSRVLRLRSSSTMACAGTPHSSNSWRMASASDVALTARLLPPLNTSSGALPARNSRAPCVSRSAASCKSGGWPLCRAGSTPPPSTTMACALGTASIASSGCCASMAARRVWLATGNDQTPSQARASTPINAASRLRPQAASSTARSPKNHAVPSGDTSAMMVFSSSGCQSTAPLTYAPSAESGVW